MKRTLKLFAIGITFLSVFLLAAAVWWQSGERQRIHDAATASAGLAAIPDLEYLAVTRGNMFSRGYWLSFNCDHDRFEEFVAASPGLGGVVPYRFPWSPTDPTPTTLSKPPDYEREMMKEPDSFWCLGSYRVIDDSPLWEHEKRRTKGRRFEIRVSDPQIYGFLLRDDNSGDVFLYVSYS